MKIITDSELELLKIFWEKGESTAREIHEESLKILKNRHYATIKTILDIMVKKNFLKRRKIGPVYLYSTKTTQQRFLKVLMNDFVHKALNGNVMPIFINFLSTKRLPKKELEQLKKIINEIEEDL